MNRNNVLIVTNDDKVFAFGSNWRGVLGFGNDDKVNELTINEELSHKQIIDFKNSSYHVIARTIDGKVYCWGYNDWGALGNGKNDWKIFKPELNKYLSDKQIIDVCCGDCHSLVLTNSGEVYAWGWNGWGLIGNGILDEYQYDLVPTKVNGFNDEKVVMISCGWSHSMALTEGGHVFSWGSNYFGQLGQNKLLSFLGNIQNKPKFLEIKNSSKINVIFVKIICGLRHSLLLSKDGNIYAFGNNTYKQLGTKRRDNYKIESKEKFTDIATHYNYNISVALSEKGKIFVWGQCAEVMINNPFETPFECFNEVFAQYFQITYKTIDFKKNVGKGKYSKDFYELNLISYGGFGSVYKAMHKESQELFAIKKIPIDENSKEKILKEAEILSKLKSEFIVELESYWIEDNYFEGYKKFANNLLLHIQMELCSMTLRRVIKKLNKDLNRKINEMMIPLGYYISSELFIEILESVDYLHKRKVIHRDLKPSNILITNGINGRFVKLGDFGLAVIHEFTNQSHTSDRGTLKYMAPEALRGRKYSSKADIFSLGIIAQELFNIDTDLYFNFIKNLSKIFNYFSYFFLELLIKTLN
jgi:alpha-tubulin suppressor-like RCC1 family protein